MEEDLDNAGEGVCEGDGVYGGEGANEEVGLCRGEGQSGEGGAKNPGADGCWIVGPTSGFDEEAYGISGRNVPTALWLARCKGTPRLEGPASAAPGTDRGAAVLEALFKPADS